MQLFIMPAFLALRVHREQDRGQPSGNKKGSGCTCISRASAVCLFSYVCLEDSNVLLSESACLWASTSSCCIIEISFLASCSCVCRCVQMCAVCICVSAGSVIIDFELYTPVNVTAQSF